MTMARKRIPVPAALAVLTVLLSGCVVVDVGKPVSFSREKETERKSTTRQETLLAVEPEFEGRGSNATVHISKTIQTTTRAVNTATLKKIDIRSQKRMAVGLFPGWGMCVQGENDKIRPYCILGQSDTHPCTKGFGLVLGVLVTPFTLLVTPFTEWTATVGFHGGYQSGGRYVRFAGDMELNEVFSPRELAACGVSSDVVDELLVLSTAGVVKYPVVEVRSEDLDSNIISESVTTNVHKQYLRGPFEVELRIPEVGFRESKTVSKFESKADFTLPTDYRAEEMEPCKDKWGRDSQRRRRYRGLLTFRNTGSKDYEQEAWAKAAGRSFEIELCLEKGAPYANPPVREVVREVQIIRETRVVEERKPEGPRYNVEKSADGTGRTVWRVKILNGNLNAFGVDGEVRPRILQELRDDFAGRNPHVPPGEINAFASYTTEEGGRTLVYVGVAESLIPSLESLTYSAETRRGTVTMRLAGGKDDLPRSKEFVRANISAIVCDKNVALTAGERPPDGARYRSLDENFAGGVLTVEFEAVE